jgi:hypothetical protein
VDLSADEAEDRVMVRRRGRGVEQVGGVDGVDEVVMVMPASSFAVLG